MDLRERIRDRLAESGITATLKRLDRFTGDEGVVIRLLPATITHRDLDRKRHIDQPFAVIVVNRSERLAKDLCERIEDLLDDTIIPSADGSYECVTNQIYIGTEELDLDEDNIYAYQVRFTAEIVR